MINQSANSAKQLAIQTARKTLQESNEFLKSAREQINPFPLPVKKDEQKETQQQEKPDAKKVEGQNTRLKEALDRELEDIRKENLFKDLQKRIAEGEEVELIDFTDLSWEQREVLQAQMTAVKMQRDQTQETKRRETLPQIISKKGRGMVNLIKGRNEKHVEMRQPPSG